MSTVLWRCIISYCAKRVHSDIRFQVVVAWEIDPIADMGAFGSRRVFFGRMRTTQSVVFISARLPNLANVCNQRNPFAYLHAGLCRPKSVAFVSARRDEGRDGTPGI